MEKVEVEIRYHDKSSVVYKRDERGVWYYSEYVPGEENSKLLVIDAVVSNRVLIHLAEALMESVAVN